MDRRQQDGEHVQGSVYTSWEQVAGYFDGDGNVRVEAGIYVLRIGIRFADTWRPQLVAVRNFLLKQGIKSAGIGTDSARLGNRRTAYRLDVGEADSVLGLVREMIGYCVKKQEDLRIGLDYLEDRITADEAVRQFNEQVRIGRRRGTSHSVSIPYTKSLGHRTYELTVAKRASDAHFIRLDSEHENRIREDRETLHLSIIKLSKKYGYSQSVIRRILGRP